MTDLAFNLKDVRKSYQVGKDEIEILHGIDLQIPAGSYVAITGPSGSGKSTLMQLLGCLDVPTHGTVSVLGHDTSTMSDDDISGFRARALGFVFQGFHLLPSYDAVSNVALSMAYTNHSQPRDRATQLLGQLGLAHRLHHRPRMMSGGEQQRVAVARAIANDSPILLADEPTGALDQANGRALLALFDGFHRQGKTVILVTHDMSVAAHARRVVEIVDGMIRRDGPPR